MNPINLLGFAGAALAPNVRLLNERVGVNVVDAEPGNGELLPLHDRLTVATVPTGSQQQTIYRMGRDVPNDALYWLSWSTIVNVIRSFEGADTTERTYFTGSGTPKWTSNAIGLGSAPYPQATRELAVPAPISAPAVVLTTDGTDGDEGDRFYVTTFVNDLGWESAPSPVSSAVTLKPGGAVVDLSSLEAAPAGAYGITLRRIYRTQPEAPDGAATFFFLGEVAIGTTTFTDNGQVLGDPLATIGWIPMPANAKGLIGLWNGMAAAISGKTVIFTEPYAPYTTPVKYDKDVFDTPVALAKWEQNLLVLTTGRSLLMNGSDPAGMNEQGAYAGQPCVSARGVVEFPHGVVWPSNEGAAYSGQAEVITLGIFKPEQWKALHPDTIIAGRYGRLYVASYNDGSGRKGLMLDPLRPQDGVWLLSTGFDACWYDELADALYVLEGGNVRKFDAATARLTATFKSKVYRQVAPRNFGWAKVVADVYPLTLKVWADAVDPVTHERTMPLRITKTVLDARPFKLPGGFLSEDWQVEVSAGAGVQAVHLATDKNDLRGG